ncbi:hypothetical protein PV328_002735 [Microctonus aethiopoides]|uniref:DUF4776 domain-containing protein n=1 Tax=Microctonus aethiopoides TaxID=144406 RepID=A0AA39KJW4_9HYME|nr:hypothetical protein PV328_002735 [Microctonus aethiopoides]
MSTNQHNKKINKPFNIAKAPLKTTMNNPDFLKLTAAEKLNDSEYRRLIYRTYPNEPTCGCASANGQQSSKALLTIDKHQENSSDNFLLKCPGGCKSSCCSSLRRSPTINNENNSNDDKRIRGGGDGFVGEMYRKNADAIEIECTNYNTRCQYGNHSPESRGININELNNNLMSGYWCPSRENIINKAEVNCDDNGWKNSDYEIDRFVNALNDAQKFVDSLGKVPGVAGLGLMDPEESPYFRGNRKIVIEKSSEFKSNNNLMINSQMKSTAASTSSWIKVTPFTISVPGRGGIVHEAILPEKRIEESKDIIEGTSDGPCGKVNCRSRRKIIINREASLNKVEEVEKFDEVVGQPDLQRESKSDKIIKHKRRKMFMGPDDGNGIFKSKKSRKANYVYLAGETYPGYIYGHKNCNDRPERVPAHMGWLWTQYKPVGRLKPRVGWRPGAISRQIREIIQEAKIGFESTHRRRRPTSMPSFGMLPGMKMKTRSYGSLKKGHVKKQDEDIEELEPPPTLQIQRRDGAYYITMYPIRQETMDVPKLEEPIKPLQFTIPKKLEDYSDSSSSIASDMDIEFSPPAAVNRYKKLPNVIHVETQVKQKDIINTFKPAVDNNKQIDEKIEIKKVKKIKKKSKKAK